MSTAVSAVHSTGTQHTERQNRSSRSSQSFEDVLYAAETEETRRAADNTALENAPKAPRTKDNTLVLDTSLWGGRTMSMDDLERLARGETLEPVPATNEPAREALPPSPAGSGLSTTTPIVRLDPTISPNGAYVTVTQTDAGYTLRYARAREQDIQLNLTENTRILELPNGELGVSFPDSGKRFVLSLDGSVREATDADMPPGTSGNDILVNLTGDVVDGGDGDDMIFNFAQNATILGGKGNDIVVLGKNSKNLRVDTGDGDDALYGADVENADIRLGSGNNRVRLDQLGAGATLSAGNGNNDIQLDTVTNGATVSAGNGNNSLQFKTLTNGASVHLGNGNNDLYGDTMDNGATVELGNGNNTAIVRSIAKGSTYKAGNGNNELLISWLTSGALVDMGNGNNRFRVLGSSDGGKTSLGNGNNNVRAVTVTTGSSMQFGNGNNSVFVEQNIDNGSTVAAGNGNNAVRADSLASGATVSVGAGENSLYFGNHSDDGGNVIVNGKPVTDSLTAYGLFMGDAAQGDFLLDGIRQFDARQRKFQEDMAWRMRNFREDMERMQEMLQR